MIVTGVALLVGSADDFCEYWEVANARRRVETREASWIFNKRRIVSSSVASRENKLRDTLRRRSDFFSNI